MLEVMESQELKNSTLTEIVSQNYVYASILYYFGIRFFDYSEETLCDVCKKKGIDVQRVIQELSDPSGEELDVNKVSSFPVDLLIEFLKHSHYNFAKKKLPYLANLIDSLEGKGEKYGAIERDLKVVFPMFVEDFIHHIYLEEDTFFKYVIKLYKAVSGRSTPGRIFYEMKKYSVTDFAAEHDIHDDEMEGIRKITKDYEVLDDTPLQIRVVYSELSSFESELIQHAKVENNILFPKALGLENEARKMIDSISKYN